MFSVRPTRSKRALASPGRLELPLLGCRFDVVQLRLRGLPCIRQPHLVRPAPLLKRLQHDGQRTTCIPPMCCVSQRKQQQVGKARERTRFMLSSLGCMMRIVATPSAGQAKK